MPKTDKKKPEKKIINKKDENEKEELKNGPSEEVANLKEVGVMTVAHPDERIQILPIIGQIEGHNISNPQTKATKYEHVIPQLIAMERDDKVKGILIVLNTIGGDVEAGLAIAEMISSLSKPTVSIVIGGGHSIGVPLATSSDYSFISPSATMIVHPIRMNGFVIGVPQTFEYLDKMQDRVVRFVTKHSKISEEKFKDLMFEKGNLTRDIGTNVMGTDAVEYGLIDEIGGVGKALKKLNELIDLNNEEMERLVQ